MPIERIEGASDPRVAAYRDVRDGDLVRSRGLFVAEGRLVVRRVIAERRYRVQSVLVNDAACRDLQATWPDLDAEVPIFVGDAALRVPFARAAAGDWPGILARVRAAGLSVIALTPHEPCETLDAYSASLPRPTRQALLVGTEGAGLSPDAEAAADHRVRIPMTDGVDSLNLAVATGIALHALRS